MLKKWKKNCFFLILLLPCLAQAALPKGFVYLGSVDPNIQQAIRYAGYHNFIGRPITGYGRPVCILTQPAAESLENAEKMLLASGYSLKVYDCYRPQRAVDDFYTWSKNPKDQLMKAEFYPRTDKAKLFDLGYIALQSGHSRGSTVDLTLVPLPLKPEALYTPGQKLEACYAPYKQRFQDNSIDMGTGYDCLDVTAHVNNPSISRQAYQNRLLLRKVMIENGFVPYDNEWWHFTLKNEPYPKRAFDFPVR
ncbi:MAG: M15 family metallopeptidase [Legionellales bacterium]|nr:M15 family metallopeptidase [Legionellales bacterium]